MAKGKPRRRVVKVEDKGIVDVEGTFSFGSGKSRLVLVTLSCGHIQKFYASEIFQINNYSTKTHVCYESTNQGE